MSFSVWGFSLGGRGRGWDGFLWVGFDGVILLGVGGLSFIIFVAFSLSNLQAFYVV